MNCYDVYNLFLNSSGKSRYNKCYRMLVIIESRYRHMDVYCTILSIILYESFSNKRVEKRLRILPPFGGIELSKLAYILVELKLL